MKNQWKRLIGLMLVLAMTVSLFAACGKTEETGKDGEPTTTPSQNEETEDDTDEPAPTEEPARDLNAREIVIGDWWSQEGAEPKTQQEEDTLAYREEIMAKHNFTIKEQNIGTWGEYQEIFVTSTMAGDPAADIFVMDMGFVAAPLQQGLLYPLNTLESFDFSEEKWISTVKEYMTIGDDVFGMKTGRLEPRLGVFWNKRLFEEAGLDPELPYDLQANGEWTWDAFKEIAAKTTRDVDNDGTPDTYGLASFSADFFKGVVLSNGADFIEKDENGKFVNGAGNANFLEALQWGRSLYDDGYHAPQPEGSEWDWFIPAFRDSQVAMTVAEQYKVGTWAEMDDDWGFVIFPKGPKGEMTTVFQENVVVLPASLNETDADEIAFAYNLYTEDTPGYEDADWKTNYYPLFRDARAVEETLELFYEPGHGRMSNLLLVNGVELGDVAFALDGNTETPAEVVEKVQSQWQTFIDEANGDAQ